VLTSSLLPCELTPFCNSPAISAQGSQLIDIASPASSLIRSDVDAGGCRTQSSLQLPRLAWPGVQRGADARIAPSACGSLAPPCRSVPGCMACELLLQPVAFDQRGIAAAGIHKPLSLHSRKHCGTCPWQLKRLISALTKPTGVRTLL